MTMNNKKAHPNKREHLEKASTIFFLKKTLKKEDVTSIISRALRPPPPSTVEGALDG
jgi:hypothetical protein